MPKTMDELRERLDGIRMEESPSAEAYLWDFFRCWSRDLLDMSHPEEKLCQAWIREKLDVLGREDVPDMVRVGRRLTGGYWSHAASQVIKAIDQRAGPEHKALILASHDVNFNLLNIIRKFGWEKEALNSMLEKSKHRTPPHSWDEFFLAERPTDQDLILKIAARHYDNKKILRMIEDVSDIAPRALLEARWNAGKESDAYTEILWDRLALGSPDALVHLRYLVKSTLKYKREPIELVELLATMSDCPPTLPEANEWLDQYSDLAAFDPEIKRYVISAPGTEL